VQGAGVFVLVLAAGNAGRFGSPKQIVPVNGVPLVRRAALAGLAVAADVVIVTGAHADAVADALHELPVEMLHNPEWADGMGTSIACGIRHVAKNPAAYATMICLPDQPLVEAAQLQRLIEAYDETPGHIIASDYGPTLGAPCIFPRRYYVELTALSGPEGARRVLAGHAANIRSVAMPEASIDIDTEEEYQRLLNTLP
jgi:CTP:molybdopterin cytidylyltransferase MocA